MKNTGWVLLDTEEKGYVDAGYGSINVGLSDANIFSTRKEAREIRCSFDRVRKVRLDENGKVVEIIPGKYRWYEDSIQAQCIMVIHVYGKTNMVTTYSTRTTRNSRNASMRVTISFAIYL